MIYLFFFNLETLKQQMAVSVFSPIGSLLLLVNNYANSDGRTLIPHTALGILLLLIALLLAYTGRP